MSTVQPTCVDQSCLLLRRASHETKHDGVEKTARRSWHLGTIVEGAYEALDMQIEVKGVESSRRYGAFLRVLYLLQRDLDAVYGRPDLRVLAADCHQRRQLLKLEYALSALGVSFPPITRQRLSASTTWASVTGWLFVGEATNLYAAILYRLIQRRRPRQRDESCNRLQAYLFDAPEAVDRRWRSTVRALDEALLSPQEEKELLWGTKEAVQQLRRYVEAELR
ncbi:hypothetical protein [Alcaligenes sp.]|uniref:hypothetical protein n=1 Tax=Alcaligenes sp. TaxID=512 RepID=UPI003D078B24